MLIHIEKSIIITCNVFFSLFFIVFHSSLLVATHVTLFPAAAAEAEGKWHFSWKEKL